MAKAEDALKEESWDEFLRSRNLTLPIIQYLIDRDIAGVLEARRPGMPPTFRARDAESEAAFRVARLCPLGFTNQRAPLFPFYRWLMYALLTMPPASVHRQIYELNLLPRRVPDRRHIATLGHAPRMVEPITLRHVEGWQARMVAIVPELKNAILGQTRPRRGKELRLYRAVLRVCQIDALVEEPHVLLSLMPLLADPSVKMRVDSLAVLDGSAADIARLISTELRLSVPAPWVAMYRRVFMDAALLSPRDRDRFFARLSWQWIEGMRQNWRQPVSKVVALNTEQTGRREQLKIFHDQVRRRLADVMTFDGEEALGSNMKLLSQYTRLVAQAGALGLDDNEAGTPLVLSEMPFEPAAIGDLKLSTIRTSRGETASTVDGTKRKAEGQ